MSALLFPFRTLRLSIWVALRMIPVLALTALSAIVLFVAVQHDPVALVLLFVAWALLVSPMLMLFCVRAGLTALGATRGLDLARLLGAAVKMLFFPMMATGLAILLLVAAMLGTLFGVLYLLTQMDLLDGLLSVIGDGSLTTDGLLNALRDPDVMMTSAAPVKIAFYAIMMLAGAIGWSIFGVTYATAGAVIAVKGPKHGMIYGIGRRFGPLLLVNLLLVAIPNMLVYFYFILSIEDFIAATLAEMPTTLEGGVTEALRPLLWPFAISQFIYFYTYNAIMPASFALAYVDVTEEDAKSFQAEMDAMLGPDVPSDDIRALRQERQDRNAR